MSFWVPLAGNDMLSFILTADCGSRQDVSGRVGRCENSSHAFGLMVFG